MPEPLDLRPTPPAGSLAAEDGAAHPADLPVLDVRQIPHIVRHGAVIGAVGSLPTGASLVLVAPHDPLPLLAQLADRAPVHVTYLVSGPEAWHLRLTRREGRPT